LTKRALELDALRALASDLAYLEAWVLAATGTPLPWPAPEALALKFVAQHLWDPARRDTDPGHGMPENIAAVLRAEGLLRADGPHAPATVRRRLSSWAILHHWKGIAGPFRSPALRSAIRLAVRGTARLRTRKSEKAVTADVLERLLATCASDRLVDARDAALLLVAFASGGGGAAKSRGCGSSSSTRRRRFLRSLRSQVHRPALPVDPAWPHQDHRGRRGRKGVSGWASGRGVAGMAVTRGHCEGAGIPGDRSMGWLGRQGADAAIGQRDPEAPDRIGRARSQGVFRVAGRLSDRGGTAWGFVARGDAAIAASFRAAGGELLQ